MSPSVASWIVTVAAEEGFVEIEHRGSDVRGLWLMPAVERGTRSVVAAVQSVATRDTRVYSKTNEAEDETMMNIDPHGAAVDLRALADQIEQACATDSFDSEIRLEHLQDEEATTRLISGITTWEREVADARYLYSLTVSDTDLSVLDFDHKRNLKIGNG